MELPTLNRILFVEDDPDIQSIARIALVAVGKFTVEICSSGTTALETAPQFAPDLILLDVMMPGMDGPSTLKALRQLPEIGNIPIIFMTAKIQTHEVAYYKALGALNVIAKPFDPMTLPVTIRGMWQQFYA
ncbi:response regulator [Leptolyngbya sp. FACHB-36]|uniref:response regulator n=1 Tax=Leptolyngbya sp. FACHB-36 TaxID=2692808 RepID=UPI001680A358|nr:response regulator [Leptolyngbya sp. FACHB-36]MBD2020033.1 response regulator [Leptolyngbya sp. FACHB-36]